VAFCAVTKKKTGGKSKVRQNFRFSTFFVASLFHFDFEESICSD
jgi:hypothetical protein